MFKKYAFGTLMLLLLINLIPATVLGAGEENGREYYLELEEMNPALTEGYAFTGAMERNRSIELYRAAPSSIESYYVTPDLPPTESQGDYGSCWAITANTLAELSIQKKENRSLDFSEVQLAYFTYQQVSDPLGGIAEDYNGLGETATDFLNQGGNMLLAIQSLSSWKGYASESVAPYENAEDYIAQGLPVEAAFLDEAHIRNAFFLNLSSNRQEAKLMIKEYGGIGGSYYNSISAYNENYNSYYSSTGKSTNHAITLVGWDDNFPKENFNEVAPDDGAWLVRNSWGQNDMSYNGYFWMSYYEKTLSANGYVIDAVSDTSDEFYDNIYQYDGGVYYQKSEKKMDAITAANVFVGTYGKEELKAVSFETFETNEIYEIEIYRNLTDPGNPQSGELLDIIEGKTTFAGLYTIPVSSGLLVDAGESYSVVVTLKKQGNETGIMVEAPYGGAGRWLDCRPSANAGESFLFENGSWMDYGATKNQNIRIKAYTNLGDYTFAFSKERLQLERGRKAKLVLDTDWKGSIQWTSSNPEVAIVENGQVEALGYGETEITASYGNGVKSESALGTASCVLQVLPPEVKLQVRAKNARERELCFQRIEGVTGYKLYRGDSETDNSLVESEELIDLVEDNLEETEGIAFTEKQITFWDDMFDENQDSVYWVVAYVDGDDFYVESTVSQGSKQEVNYVITYHLNGGENHEENPKSYTAKDGKLLLKSPTKKGAKFLGWYRDKECTKSITSIDPAGDKVYDLYAGWDKGSSEDEEPGSEDAAGAGNETDTGSDETLELLRGKYKSPACGDTNQPILWIVMLGSGCILVIIAREKGKKTW